MSDTPVDRPDTGPYDPAMETRVSRLEEDMGDVKALLVRLEPMIVRIDASILHLATQAQMAELRGEMGGFAIELRGDMERFASGLRGEVGGFATGLRAELAEKPSKAYLWAVLGVLTTSIIAAFGAGLAAVAILH